MATPTLSNLNAAEEFRTALLDLTDMVPGGTGTITIVFDIAPTAGTLEFVPATTDNLPLENLGGGQYRLVGDEASLTPTLAHLGFVPAPGFAGTFDMQVQVQNAEGTLEGSKTFSFQLEDGDALALGDGSSEIFLFKTLAGSASVDAGTGADTLRVTGSDALTIDFSQAGQQVTSGSPSVTYSAFENLDAATASGNLDVTLAATSTSIVSGSGADTVAFRDVVASVNAGGGSDTLKLDTDLLSAPAASTAMTINLAAANANQVSAGAPAGASWQNFENLDAGAWDKNLTVTANAAGSVIATGSGLDTVTLGAGADSVSTGAGNDRVNGAIGTGDTIDLGIGNDTATFASSASGVVSGGADVDTLLHAGGAATINLATNSHFTGFENLSASTATGALTFTGVAATTAVTTGAGNDVINVAAATGAVSIKAGAGNNTITGGAGNDSITLSTGTDNIRGGGGNDTIVGNLTVGDRVLLDGGDDTINLPTTAIAVTVDGGAGSDTLVVRGSAAQTFNFAASDDNGALAGKYTNFENINGSAATGALTVTGVAGTTRVTTGAGADIINVAAAAQGVTINAGNGINTVTGSAFADTFTLGSGKDVINAGNGADTVNGALTAGDQVLLQGSSDTFLYRALSATGTLVDGGTGVDTLQYTGSTAKTFNFASAADNVSAETGLYKAFENLDASAATGAVTVTGATTTTRISGGSGADIITATTASGGVRVDAGAGNDRVTTGAGADTIVYGAGTDTVDAGAGIDELEVGAGAGALTINFAVAAGADQVSSASTYKNLENLDGASADGALTVTLGAQTRAVTTGSGDDTVNTGALTTVTAAIALGAGDDSVVVTTTNTHLAGASLSGVEHLVLSNNVDATLSIAQNALLDSAAGTNTVTLAAAGTAQGAAEVESYRLANGVNDFTLGAGAQNVTGGTGNDTVHTNGLSNLTGTLALGGGSDALVIDITATDISGMTLSAVESVVLATDVNASMSIAQNALVADAAGVNTVTLVAAGTASGAAEVEIYRLADGANTFTLGAAAQSVIGGSGDDSIKSGTLSSVTGVLEGVGGDDVLLIESDATVAATLFNIDALHLASGVDVTTDIDTANLITSAVGVNSVTLTNAGTVTGNADIESYQLADGGNDFTLGASAQNVSGGSGDDVFNSDALTSLTGTLVGGGGNDVLNIQSSMQLSATLTDIDTIAIASNVDLTTIIADNALIGSAAGSNFVTLLDAGTLTGAAEIEAYRLADGGNTFTLGSDSQSVIGGSGDDVVHSGAFTALTGTYTLDGGDDSVVLDTDLTDLSAATLTAVEHLALANDVDATITLAQNALLDSALGDNTVTLFEAGTASGAASVEKYVLANGANSFTLGAAAQAVDGGSGDDVVHTGTLGSLTNLLSLGGGNDTLVVDTTATDISGLGLTSVEAVTLGNNVDATMTIAENALVASALGTNTVTLSDAGTATGQAEVENYQLADGGTAFTLGAAAQNVTGGSGDDSFNTGAQVTVSGVLNGTSGNDVVNVDASATLSATLSNIDAVNLGNNVNLTTSIANNALLNTATGTNTVTLAEAGTASGAAAVENYVLADGANSFTLGAAAQNVTGGSGDDVVHSGALATVSGTLSLGVGNDKLVVDTTGANIAAATLNSVEAVDLANNVSITTSLVNNALLAAALGTNTVTLSAAGTASGAAEVENYVLANGSNSFTLGASAQNVSGGSGDDALTSGALTTVSGTLDGGSGNDTLTMEQSATLSASLGNIEAVDLANNVNLTTSIANNALIATALGNNTVTLDAAGVASGAAEVESYVLANGANSFTLGASAQNVSGGTGDDSLKSGALSTVSGTLDGVSGNDTLTVEQNATVTATLANIDALNLANNVNVTTSLANNALIGSALGSNTVTLNAVGVASGAAEVENYVLADGGNTFTLGASAQNVTGGTGDDSLKTGALTTVGGTLDGVGGNDTLTVELSGTLSATLTNIDAVILANNVNLTTSITNNALITTAAGSNTVTLSDAGTASGAAQVENYQLADGGNIFTLAAAAQNVTGGSGADVVHTGALTTVSGTLALGGGNDTLVVDTTATNISTATLTSVESLQLGSNVNASMSIAQHALLDSAAGANTVTLTDAGSVSGAAEVESYQLANGGNSFTLGANGQDVSGGSGIDVVTAIDTQLAGAVLDGGGARDTVVVTSSAPGVSAIGGTINNFEVIDLTGVVNGATFTATATVEEVRGGAGADDLSVAAVVGGASVSAGTGADTVTGGAGNDVIDVGVDNDADLVNAGGGSDTVTNFGAGDTINYEGGADTATYAAVTATVDGGTGGGVDTLTVTATSGAMSFDFSRTNQQQILAGGTGTYSNFENLAAGAAGVDDAITVVMSASTTAVTTGSGDDTITFRSQSVSVDAGAGTDTLVMGGSGVIVVDLSTSGDQVGGLGSYTGFENLDGSASSATLVVIGGENTATVRTGSGNDSLSGGLSLDGGAGNNNITADSRTTTVVAGSGNDNLDASAAAQGVTVNLGDGANQVLGSAFADSITLGAGADIIDAGAGSDDIIGVVSAGDALNLEGDDDTFTYQALNGAGSSVDGGDDSDTLVVDAGGSALIIDFSNTNDQIAAETGSYRNFENLAAGNATVDLTVITGSAGGVIVTGSGDDDVTLSAANDDVSTGAGDDVINVTAATLNSAIDAGGNTATGDTLNVLGGGTLGMSVTAVGIENVSLAVATDFTANALGGLRITGSAGDDTITVGAADQVVAGAGGDDVIKVSDAVLASTLSVDGGAATSGDTLAVTSDATVIDGDFAQVVSIETLQLAADAADNAQSVTVGANAEAGGLLAIDTTTAGADDDITIDASGFSAALAINTGAGADHIVLGAGGSTVNAGAGDNTVTVGAANDGVEDDNITSAGGDDYFLVGDARLTGNLDIAAGGGSDSLEVTTDASVADADLAGLVSVERLLLGADAGDDAQAVTLGANAMAAGLTGVAVVDTATNDDISVDASAFNNALAIDTGAGDDQLVLGSGGSVVDARGGNNVITVGGANDGSQDDSIVTQGGNDRVLVSDAQLTHFLSVSAGAGSDTLELTSDADIVDADLAGLAGVEILALTTDAGDDAQGITLGTAALAAGVTTVDGTAAGGDDALTIDSQAFSGALTINTAAGADAITLGAGGSVVDSGDGNDLVVVGAANDADTHDVISTGLGADAVQVDSALFTEHLVLDGGNANDTLRINLDVSVVDADFTQVTSVEAIALIADASGNLNEITLGSAAAASGLASIDATPGGSDDVLHLDARAFANALNVTSGAAADVIELGGGGSTVNAGNGNNIITVGAVNDGVTDDAITTGSGDDRVRSTNAQLTDQLSINAGTGLDTVEVTSDASVVDADFTQLLSVETLGLSADAVDNAQNVVLGAQAANAGLTHVDASGVGANDAIGIDASGFANALAIDTAAGDDVIVLGAGGSVVDAGDGDNDITLGAANDGVHDDVITVGAGADRIVATSAQVTSHLTLDAGAGSDTLEINTDVALVDVDFGGVDALETLKLVANAADDDQSLTLGSAAVGAGITTVDALGIGADDSLTINAAGFNAALSIDSAASTDVIFLGAGGSTVNSGDGNDTVFSAAVNDGTLDDHLDTGTGNDIIHIDSDNFTANFVLDGGEDFDVLRLNGEVAVVDADFTHLARVEKLEVIADASGNLHTLTLDSAAAAAGIGSVDATSAGGDDVIVVDAQGFANALSIDTGAASDVITLGAGGSIVHAGDGNNTIVVGAANDGVHDDEITTGAGNDLIKTDDARFSNALLVSAGTGTDTLEVTDDAAVLDAALTQVTSVEVLKLSGNADDDAQSVTLAAHAASAGLTTLNASALGAGDALTVDASAFANALTIQTAAGDDVITLGGGGSVVNAGGGDNTVFVGADNDGVHDDHITTGAGADVVNLTDAQFSANFSFSAGAGRDEIRITSDASLADADLAGLTSVEVLTLTVDAADDAQSVVLGANAEAAGIHTVDGIGIISTDALSIDASSFSHGLTITTSLGDDVVLLGSGGTFVTTLDGADTVTVGAANDGSNNDDIDTGDGNDLVKTTDARLTANLSVIGGLGTDTLEVTSDATVSDADFTNLRGIERLTLSADAGDDAQSLVLGSLAHSAGLLAVDTTAAGSDDGINIDASAFSAGLSITSGAGDDVITLGSAGSTVTSGLGDDTVTAGAGQDDIDTGAGDDTINVSATTIAADIDGGADTGAGDTLSVTGGGAVLMGASVVNVEKVSLVSATDFIANAISGLAITGSTGDDLVHVGAGDQVVAGAGGDDIVDVEDSELSATLFVDGGAHTTGDILLVSTDASVADADLANVTTMEVLKLGVDAADHVQSVTLAANAAAAGFTHLDTTLVGSGESVNIDSTGFANALTIDGGAGSEVVLLGTGGSVVNAGAGTDHVTVGADNDGVHDDVIHLGASSDRVELTDSQLSAHLTVSGDDGTDRLEVTDDASLADADLAGITTLEVLVLKGDAADNAQSVVFAGNALSAGFTTIDASDVGANDAVSVNAAAFSAGLTLTTSSGDDIIVLGAGGSVVNAGNGANTVTVGAASDNITTGGGDDLIKVEDGKLGSLLGVAAGNGLDTLEVTSDADIAFGEFDGMTGVEVLKLSGNAADDAQLVFLGADAEAVGLTTIDSTTLDSGDSLALRLATFGNALTINTGAGDDDITLGSGGSVVDSGNGNDVITVGAANDGVTDDHITAGDGHDQIFVLAAQLSSHLEIAAGNGIDALNLASDSAVSDADFTLMTALEQVMFDFDAADNAQSITVAGLAAAAGVNRIDARFAGNDDAITIDASGFANALTIDTNGAADSIVLGAGGSVVDAGNGDNIITIGADNDGVHDDDITTGSGADLFHVTDARLSGNLAIAAGGGVDVLLLDSDADVTDADLAQVSSVEVFRFGVDAGDDAQGVVLAANAMAAGVATVDISQAGANDAVTVDASAYTTSLTVILHGGADIVTLGSGNDTLLGGVSAGDSINLGAGDDSFAITTLAAVTIDGGTDLDTLVIGAGAGSRQLDFSNGVDQLSGFGTYLNFENLQADAANGTLSVIAGHGTTSIVTGSKIDQVDAGLADQGVSISTGASGDSVIGSAHNDSIDGGTGEDFIAGGDGNDALTGGAGADTFVFDTALSDSTNVDTISDFVSGADLFQLNLDIFSALQATDGVLDADNFLAGAGAVASNGNQHIILDTTSGSLFYDADGLGGVAQVEFARLGGAHTAVATDFVIG